MRFTPALVLSALALVMSACNGGTSNVTPRAAPTAPAVAPASTFTSRATTALSSAPAAPVALGIPTSAGGFGGAFLLPPPTDFPSSGSVTLVEALTNDATTLPPSAPALRNAVREMQSLRTPSAASLSVIAYASIYSSTTLTLPNAPSLSVTVPAGDVVAGAVYRLALFDVLRPSLGWQRGFAGPATVNGTTLAFGAPAPPAPFALTANVPAVFAVYAVAAGAAAPTPAPSIAPNPAPTPIPALSIAPASLSILAVDQTATAAIGDTSGYTGAYAVSSSNAGIATAAVTGSTVTVTGVAAGNATITVTDNQARAVTLPVQITVTNLPLN